jgi:hypothetical protein
MVLCMWVLESSSAWTCQALVSGRLKMKNGQCGVAKHQASVEKRKNPSLAVDQATATLTQPAAATTTDASVGGRHALFQCSQA